MLANIAAGHPGAAAYVDGQFAGYLIGFSALSGFFGRQAGVYVPVWGHAVAATDRAADVYQALYAEMSTTWIARSCHNAAITYFMDAGTQAFEESLFATGFGLQVIDGLRPMDPVAGVSPETIDIRRASEGDLTVVAELDVKLGRHLRSAPIFLHTRPVAAEDLRERFLGDGVCTLIAWQNGVAVGGIRGVLNRSDGCDLFSVEGTLAVNFGYTEPEARRTGIATALLDALLAWGREQGMVRCSVDFESANITARRFWLTQFRPVCHSAVRKIDDRF